MKARVAVLQVPGVNCEDESLHALALAGIEAELFRAARPAAAKRSSSTRIFATQSTIFSRYFFSPVSLLRSRK